MAINTLAVRHLMQPFKPGDRLIDHAAPISEVMQQLQTQLAEYKALKELLAGGAMAPTAAAVNVSYPTIQVDGGGSSPSSSTSSLAPDSPYPSDSRASDLPM